MASRSPRDGRERSARVSDAELLDLIRRYQARERGASTALGLAMQPILKTLAANRREAYDSLEDAYQQAVLALLEVVDAYDMERVVMERVTRDQAGPVVQRVTRDIADKLDTPTRRGFDRKKRSSSLEVVPESTAQEPPPTSSGFSMELLSGAVREGLISSTQAALLVLRAQGFNAKESGVKVGVSHAYARQLLVRADKALAEGRKGRVHEWHRARKSKKTN